MYRAGVVFITNTRVIYTVLVMYCKLLHAQQTLYSRIWNLVVFVTIIATRKVSKN